VAVRYDSARGEVYCDRFIIIIIIIIIIRFHGLSKQSAFAQLVVAHEFVQSVLEDLQ